MPKLWVAVLAVSAVLAASAVSAFRRFGVSALYKSFGVSRLAKSVSAGNLNYNTLILKVVIDCNPYYYNTK